MLVYKRRTYAKAEQRSAADCSFVQPAFLPNRFVICTLAEFMNRLQHEPLLISDIMLESMHERKQLRGVVNEQLKTAGCTLQLN